MPLVQTNDGGSIGQFIQYTRIHHAKQFLATTDWPVATIAREVGFNNISYFSLMFKRLEGVTPQSYRKSVIQETLRKANSPLS